METPDPLLPQPDATLHLPRGLSGEARMKAMFEAVSDHINLNAMAWPAADSSGVLVAPPDEHVLDHLARSHDLVDEERAASTLSANTVAVLTELPECDLCGGSARYDARVTIGDRLGGASLCDHCYREHGSMTLGASGDTYLMLTNEVSPSVRDTCNAICAETGRPALF